MPSPFPGMDPYIESWLWGDFHASLISAVRDQLNGILPKRFIASSDLYVWKEELSDEERVLLGGPDVQITARTPPAGGAAVATVPAAWVTTLPDALERKQRYLQVVNHEQRRVVTVIELLSPSNKRTHSTGDAYRFKREEYLASRINLVEVDLLRKGQRPFLGDPAPPVKDYYLMVFRGWDHSRLAVWPFSIRDPFPPVPIPLDPELQEVVVDLHACFEHAYRSGRYDEQLNYSEPPTAPLSEPDATWAQELIQKTLTPGASPP